MKGLKVVLCTILTLIYISPVYTGDSIEKWIGSAKISLSRITNGEYYVNKIDTLISKIKESEIKLKIIHNKIQVIKAKIWDSTSEKIEEMKTILLYFNEAVEKELSGKSEELQDNIHIKTPKVVKSLYYTSASGGNKKKLDTLIHFVKNTEINSVTLDIKEVDGYVAFNMSEYKFGTIKPISNNRIKDIKALIQTLHDNNVYIIGRIVVFKDRLLSERRPDLAIKWKGGKEVWYDYKWNQYMDPYSKEVWDYNINISRAAYQLWFDEINYDYVRFPSDGKISQTYYPFAQKIQAENPKWGKIMVLDKFSSYITSTLKDEFPNIILSADVFWLVTRSDLFMIWQNLESFLLYFDYIWPMVYPSHYSNGTLGLGIADNHPYEIIKNALHHTNRRIDALNEKIKEIQEKDIEQGQKRRIKIKDAFFAEKDIDDMKPIPKTKIRPWLQWFSCTWCKGYTPYNREKFRKQVSAIEDSWLNSWWVWNSASNYYFDWYNKE
jgi:hypothetical protein